MLTLRKSTAALAAIATAGVSSIFMGATPAFAATAACDGIGDVVGPGICELTFTSDGVFTPTANMTKLEVLLVGAGASGLGESSRGYGGGGGEVKIVDFSGTTTPLTMTVAATDVTGATNGTGGSVDDSVNPATTVTNGGLPSFAAGGTSGSGQPANTSGGPTDASGGGGAGASPTVVEDGGPGIVVSAIAPAGSLFSTDGKCYGGGGAAGVPGTMGVAGCGGGGPADALGSAVIHPLANSGGGGGGVGAAAAADLYGSDGVIVVRWNAGPITLGFVTNGHGTTPAFQTFLAGNSGSKPTDPVADGFTFKGWYTSPDLTTLADFSQGIPSSTTYYAKWEATLAATGVTTPPAVIPLGLGALVFGMVLTVIGYRRKPRKN